MAIPKLITKKKKKEKQKKGKPTVQNTTDKYGDRKTVLLPSKKTIRKAKRKEKKEERAAKRNEKNSSKEETKMVGRPIDVY